MSPFTTSFPRGRRFLTGNKRELRLESCGLLRKRQRWARERQSCSQLWPRLGPDQKESSEQLGRSLPASAESGPLRCRPAEPTCQQLPLPLPEDGRSQLVVAKSPKRDPGNSGSAPALRSLTYIPPTPLQGHSSQEPGSARAPRGGRHPPQGPGVAAGQDPLKVGKRHGPADKGLLARLHVGEETPGCPWKAPSELSAARRGSAGLTQGGSRALTSPSSGAYM